MKKTKEIAVVDEKALAQLRADFPAEVGFTRVLLPRIGMVSQDKTEGKGKAMKVVTEAGTFFVEHQTDEVNEEGKKVFKKTEIGTEFDGVILYQRKQLKYYDEATELYTSSPVYDTEDEILPLFREKAEIDRGTPAELKSRKVYQGISAKGKPISTLEDNRILYVLYKGDIYQMNLRGSSMYAFMTYARTVLPPAVMTSFGSEAKEKGTIAWNQMTFEAARGLDGEEIESVMQKVTEIKQGIADEKNYYNAQTPAEKEF